MNPVPPPLPPAGQPPYPLPPGPYPGYPYQPPRPPGWMARNWPWFVPVGCVSALVLLAAFGVGIAVLVFGVMKASEPYKTAMTRARENPQVTAALGTPIKEPFYLTGQINEGGGTGSASMAIPLAGPKAKGTLYVIAKKSGGAWKYQVMRVRMTATSQSIDLLSDQEP